MTTHIFRLKPDQDLRIEIERFVEEKNIKAGILLTCVGNLKKAILRMADERFTKEYEGTFEIVSLVGTMEVGNSHLHMSISDKDGNVSGGHVKKGCVVGITAEIAIGELEDLTFKRELDEETKFEELVVWQKTHKYP